MKVDKYEYRLILNGLRLLWYKEKNSDSKNRIEMFATKLKEEWKNVNSPSSLHNNKEESK